eukprot:scaffold1827_cov338-Chaetoceros_neogracile.AAC.2
MIAVLLNDVRGATRKVTHNWPTASKAPKATSRPKMTKAPTVVSAMPSTTPSESCSDDPEGWYDIDGPTFSCEWYGGYGGYNYCADIGDDYANFGTTANQACCVCGGGSRGNFNWPTTSKAPKATSQPSKMTKAPTVVSAMPSTTPTDDMEGTVQCPGLHVYEYCDCTYDCDNNPSFCACSDAQAEGCCGGSQLPSTAPSESAQPSAPVSLSCSDDPEGWYDIDGATYSCEWYGDYNRCALDGDSYANFGTTANQACCVCGGGSRGTNFPTKPTPSPSEASAMPSTTPSESAQPSETSWVQMGADIDGEAAEDRSGRSVSLSNDGTVVAIGAPRNDANGSSSGHVRIIAWNSTSWVQRGNDLDGEASIDQSGTSVSLNNDGTVVAIGANSNDENGPYSGHVRIYVWDSPTKSWVQMGNDIDGEASQDRSGDSVSLSNDGTVVAIGATGNDGVNGINSGHVRIYAWDSTSWVRRGNDIDGEAAYDYSGRSVSLSNDGTVVAIGASRNDGVNGSYSGHVRIYTWDSTSWVQRGNDLDGEAADDYSSDVSLNNDGTVVAIGAVGNDGNGTYSGGHVRIYTWDSTSWVQMGNDIDGEYAEDRSGRSVSLGNDGTVVAIGAPYNDENGSSSGHVRVYAWDSTSWVQRGNDLNGEAAGDYSGESVSLNNDGTVVAIGALGNDENGSMSGHVRVYSFGLPVEPSPLPSDEPSPLPSDEPIMPTETPSVSQLPSTTPSESAQPSETPSVSQLPSANPSVSAKPSAMPSTAPSLSAQPSETPSVSQMPSETPSASQLPSETPSVSAKPSAIPSTTPSESAQPSETPSVSQIPSEIPSVSQLPSETPSVSQLPSAMPSTTPSKSAQPSETPSVSKLPSETPSVSQLPSAMPSTAPSESAQPSETPSVSQLPSETPSVSTQPSVMPSAMPSETPSVSQLPSETPSVSAQPSETSKPSVSPSDEPSVLPSDKPSVLPSNKPNVLSSNQRSSAVKAVGATSIALVLVMLSLV